MEIMSLCTNLSQMLAILSTCVVNLDYVNVDLLRKENVGILQHKSYILNKKKLKFSVSIQLFISSLQHNAWSSVS